jgi:hypothetical protein
MDKKIIHHITRYIEMDDFLIDFEWLRCPKGYRLGHSKSVVRGNWHNVPYEEWIVANNNE